MHFVLRNKSHYNAEEPKEVLAPRICRISPFATHSCHNFHKWFKRAQRKNKRASAVQSTVAAYPSSSAFGRTPLQCFIAFNKQMLGLNKCVCVCVCVYAPLCDHLPMLSNASMRRWMTLHLSTHERSSLSCQQQPQHPALYRPSVCRLHYQHQPLHASNAFVAALFPFVHLPFCHSFTYPPVRVCFCAPQHPRNGRIIKTAHKSNWKDAA